jgi:hypothetical protein
MQKVLIGRLLPPVQLLGRQLKQPPIQSAILASRRAVLLEHLVVCAGKLVVDEWRREVLIGRLTQPCHNLLPPLK